MPLQRGEVLAYDFNRMVGRLELIRAEVAGLALAMPRQPFLPTYANARPRFPANALRQRSLIAAAVGECVVMWSHVEVQMALVLSAIMKAQSEPANSCLSETRAHNDTQSMPPPKLTSMARTSKSTAPSQTSTKVSKPRET